MIQTTERSFTLLWSAMPALLDGGSGITTTMLSSPSYQQGATEQFCPHFKGAAPPSWLQPQLQGLN